MLVGITREISARFAECELTHIERVPIDLDTAKTQHQKYVEALEGLGASLVRLPPLDELPDSVFVEDTAVVLDEVAIIARPGSLSRRAETLSIEDALSAYRPVVRLEEPATLDGGDVLQVGKTVYVGTSGRTNSRGYLQLKELLKRYRYEVCDVPITRCLHLKSAVTQVSQDTLLINPFWVRRSLFPGWKFIDVHPREPSAANILYLPGGCVFPSQFPFTRELLLQAEIPLTLVDTGEISKAEGGVTCCSLIFNA